MYQRLPYAGSERKLVLAFDIGTTFSGVSYCILDPGKVPEIRGVTRFPAQEQVGGDSKIPTIIYYDKRGKVYAVGAEALGEKFDDYAEKGLTKAEWFKLHLRPASSDCTGSDATRLLPPLPVNKTAIDIFADFMKYLYESARTYIQESHNTGAYIWRTMEEEIQFVLTHPNGWGGAQQAQMRMAAVRAGLVPDNVAGLTRVHFVTEGEASLHYCIQRGLMTAPLQKREAILVVDAGGGTVDLSAYSQDTDSKEISFQECAPSQCHFQGSIFVTRRARTHLDVLLRQSRFYDDLDHITKLFDKSAKLRFRNREEPQYIKFATARDMDSQLGIRSGQLKLSGMDVALFFQPSITCIIEAILEVHKVTSASKISSVFLVGGFAASDWLFSQIKEALDPLGINFSRPDGHLNKAVADGGVSYYVDHFVTTRVAKYTYGVSCYTPYDSADAEHVQRSSSIFVDAAGDACITKKFSILLSKNTQVNETKEFRGSYSHKFKTPENLPGKLRETILCYKGPSSRPRWVDINEDQFFPLCTIVADGPPLKHLLVRERAASGKIYYRLNFSIILSFGLTELTAHISFLENGKETRSPAEITYSLADEVED